MTLFPQKCYEDTVQSAVNKLTNDGLIYFWWAWWSHDLFLQVLLLKIHFSKEISKYRVLSNQSQINEAIQSVCFWWCFSSVIVTTIGNGELSKDYTKTCCYPSCMDGIFFLFPEIS